MSISDKLLISILKWAVRRYQNQTSKLWFITMTSSICVPTNTVKNRIWHITFYASLEFIFTWQIYQPEMKFKVTFGCKCTESYGRSGNFNEVWKYYLRHNFWRFDEKHQRAQMTFYTENDVTFDFLFLLDLALEKNPKWKNLPIVSEIVIIDS